MFRERCTVLENKKVAPGHFVLTFSSQKISKKSQPGQFIQITCADSYEPLLPRPFSFLTTTAKELSILYHVVGKGTEILSKAKKGDVLWILGPLGNGFTFNFKLPTLNSILVGGGVGIPPLYHLAQKLPKAHTHVLLGARNKSLLLCENDFKKLKVDLRVATDDGSKGRKGFITQILEDFLKESDPKTVQIYTCGPTPMLKAVSMIARKFEVPCEVSVEVPMACGFGACLGCAIKVRKEATDHRFAIACCEGPVFQAKDLVWD